MSTQRLNGNLLQLALEGRFDIIVHGCNCLHAMGAGIAKPIKELFPEAYTADKQTAYGTKEKLGTISVAEVVRSEVSFRVVNAYTQYHYRGNGRKVSYEAIKACFEEVALRYPNARIGYPFIGAGLGGGEWGVIQPIIEKALDGCNHTLVVFQN